MATSKITIQGIFGKRSVQNTADAVFFNGLVFVFAAIVFFYNAINCSYQTILFGAVFGLLTVIFQIFYLKALSMGNVSLTVMIVNLNMIFPIAVSALFYNEQISPLRFFGIFLTVVALISGTDFKSKNQSVIKWFALTILATIANGGISITQKVFSNTLWHLEKQAFVSWGYIFASFLCIIIYITLKLKGQKKSFKAKPDVFIFAFFTGVILSIYQFVTTYAIANISGTLFFPTYAGGSIIFSTLSGVILFKDKLLQKQKISIIIGIIAVIMMNL